MNPGCRNTRLHLRIVSVFPSFPFLLIVILTASNITAWPFFFCCRTQTCRFHTVMLMKHPTKNSLNSFLTAAGFMKPKELVCPGQKMKVHQTLPLREEAIMMPPTNWEKDQHVSGVSIWPGLCVCCCPSPAWCSLQCWEWGSESNVHCDVCCFICYNIVSRVSVSRCWSLSVRFDVLGLTVARFCFGSILFSSPWCLASSSFSQLW